MRPSRFAMCFVILAALLTSYAIGQSIPKLTPFSADMQLTSGNGQQMNGKMYITPQHMRMDMQGGPRGESIMITTFANQTTDMLMPQAHMYMEFTADQAMAMGRRQGVTSNIKPLRDPSNPCASEEGLTCKNLGVEQVNGRSCDHWQVTDKNGKVTNVWIDQTLHFPIKSVSGETTWELTNIKEGEPDASLFDIPAGYRKMDMGSMMQGMQGMKPPSE